MLPERNRRDLEDIPADARAQLAFVFLETVDDAIRTALAAGLAAPESATTG
jgi:ATP-dependent Lon protease